MATRRSLRIPLPVQILRAEDRAPRFLGYLQNVSATGLFVQCARPRAPGTQFALQLKLPGHQGPPETVEAEVIWTRGYCGRNRPSAGMGLRFLRMGRRLRADLRKFCAGSDPKVHPVIEVASDSRVAS